MKRALLYGILLFIGTVFMIFGSKINENRKITEFISDFGWIIDEKSVIIENVKIPETLDDMLQNYNQIQKNAGFDFEKYTGKVLKKYTYSLKNHQDKYSVVNIFTYKGKIVGADIVSPRIDGILDSINERTYQNAS